MLIRIALEYHIRLFNDKTRRIGQKQKLNPINLY
mgnify:FL=1